MPRRTYGQYCALAHTLDVVGERWTLLVVRDLIAGPKRYTDLLSALPGLGTSLLAQRLQDLETAGIIARRVLPPPAASTVYELTAVGEELAEAILPLVTWGARNLLGPRQREEVFRVEWPLLAIAGLLESADVPIADGTYEFRIDDSVGHLRIHDRRVSVHAGFANHPDVVLSTDIDTFLDLGLARVDPVEAAAEGRMLVDGNPEAAARFIQLLDAMKIPAPRTRRSRDQ